MDASFKDLLPSKRDAFNKQFRLLLQWYNAIGANEKPPVKVTEHGFPWTSFFGSMNRDGLYVHENPVPDTHKQQFYLTF